MSHDRPEGVGAESYTKRFKSVLPHSEGRQGSGPVSCLGWAGGESVGWLGHPSGELLQLPQRCAYLIPPGVVL